MWINGESYWSQINTWFINDGIDLFHYVKIGFVVGVFHAGAPPWHHRQLTCGELLAHVGAAWRTDRKGTRETDWLAFIPYLGSILELLQCASVQHHTLIHSCSPFLCDVSGVSWLSWWRRVARRAFVPLTWIVLASIFVGMLLLATDGCFTMEVCVSGLLSPWHHSSPCIIPERFAVQRVGTERKCLSCSGNAKWFSIWLQRHHQSGGKGVGVRLKTGWLWCGVFKTHS